MIEFVRKPLYRYKSSNIQEFIHIFIIDNLEFVKIVKNNLILLMLEINRNFLKFFIELNIKTK